MNDPLLTIKTYSDEPSAQIGRAILSANGIDAAVRSDGASGFEPGLAYLSGFRIVVRAHDADAARELLTEE